MAGVVPHLAPDPFDSEIEEMLRDPEVVVELGQPTTRSRAPATITSRVAGLVETPLKRPGAESCPRAATGSLLQQSAEALARSAFHGMYRRLESPRPDEHARSVPPYAVFYTLKGHELTVLTIIDASRRQARLRTTANPPRRALTRLGVRRRATDASSNIRTSVRRDSKEVPGWAQWRTLASSRPVAAAGITSARRRVHRSACGSSRSSSVKWRRPPIRTASQRLSQR